MPWPVAIVALSHRAWPVAVRAAGAIAGPATIYLPAGAKASPEELPTGVQMTRYNQVRELVHGLFVRHQPLVLVMALGVAVRLVGRLLQDKHTDPPVVVIDEQGRFVISLAGGHLAGANELARHLAGTLGSCPVITTASDLYGLPALDVVIRSLGLVTEQQEGLKATVAALLDGQPVGLFADRGLEVLQEKLGSFPTLGFHVLDQLFSAPARYARLVVVTSRVLAVPDRPALFLRPPSLVAGVGCRRGITSEEVKEALWTALQEAGRSPASLQGLHTVDAKLAEAGLQQAAREVGLPLVGFAVSELATILEKQPVLHRSARVKQEIGVAGVCEPASLAGEKEAELIWPKRVYGRVTVALAEVKSWW